MIKIQIRELIIIYKQFELKIYKSTLLLLKHWKLIKFLYFFSSLLINLCLKNFNSKYNQLIYSMIIFGYDVNNIILK